MTTARRAARLLIVNLGVGHVHDVIDRAGQRMASHKPPDCDSHAECHCAGRDQPIDESPAALCCLPDVVIRYESRIGLAAAGRAVGSCYQVIQKPRQNLVLIA